AALVPRAAPVPRARGAGVAHAVPGPQRRRRGRAQRPAAPRARMRRAALLRRPDRSRHRSPARPRPGLGEALSVRWAPRPRAAPGRARRRGSRHDRHRRGRRSQGKEEVMSPKLSDSLRAMADRAPVDDASISAAAAIRSVKTRRALRVTANSVVGAGAAAALTFAIVMPTLNASDGYTAGAGVPEIAANGGYANDLGGPGDARLAFGVCGA